MHNKMRIIEKIAYLYENISDIIIIHNTVNVNHEMEDYFNEISLISSFGTAYDVQCLW